MEFSHDLILCNGRVNN